LQNNAAGENEFIKNMKYTAMILEKFWVGIKESNAEQDGIYNKTACSW
jgi:hypothetical protein